MKQYWKTIGSVFYLFTFRSVLFISLVILLNSIISAGELQAADLPADEDNSPVLERSYHLDQETLVRGYPVKSQDDLFTINIWPNFFDREVEVVVTGPIIDQNFRAYEFKILQDEEVPLLKKNLTVAIKLQEQELSNKYQRLYYYHSTSKVWLALTSHIDKDRGLVLSDKVDFAEATIGVLTGDSPLPDRILAGDQVVEPDDQPALSSYSITLGTDIIEKGYTVSLAGIKLAILPHILNSASVLTLSWDAANQILDYNFKSLDATKQPLTANSKIVIILPVEYSYRQKTLSFWDNNFESWRELPSSYNHESGLLRAQSPFHFGRYKVVEIVDVYVGEASWFRDSLISATPWAAANNDFPHGSSVRVTNLENQEFVDLSILSTGPFVEGRIIDLTYSAFSAIANPRQGIISVRVEPI